jgi:hypothetical protein
MLIINRVLLLALNVFTFSEPEARQKPILLTGGEKLSVATAFSQAPQKGRIPPDSASGLTFEQDKPRLDHFASNLKIDPETKAYIIIYGGRVGPAKEAVMRGRCIEEYLMGKHGITRERMTIIDGGFRESITVELFYLSSDQPNPSPVPTVNPKEVQVIKNKRGRKNICNSSNVKK